MVEDMNCWRVSAEALHPPTYELTKTKNSEVRAEQAANKKHEAIKLGLDVHADSIVVVRILDHSAP